MEVVESYEQQQPSSLPVTLSQDTPIISILPQNTPHPHHLNNCDAIKESDEKEFEFVMLNGISGQGINNTRCATGFK